MIPILLVMLMLAFATPQSLAAQHTTQHLIQPTLQDLLAPTDDYTDRRRRTEQFFEQHDPFEDEPVLLDEDDDSIDEEAEDDYFCANRLPLAQYSEEELWEECFTEAKKRQQRKEQKIKQTVQPQHQNVTQQRQGRMQDTITVNDEVRPNIKFGDTPNNSIDDNTLRVHHQNMNSFNKEKTPTNCSTKEQRPHWKNAQNSWRNGLQTQAELCKKHSKRANH